MIYRAENHLYRGPMATLAEIVKERRLLLKLTQRQLGTAAGVSHAYINQIEAGEVNLPSPGVLGPLAKALKVGEDVLLRSVGYLQDQAELAASRAFPRPLGAEETWRQLVEVFDGDEVAARKHLYETLGIAIEETET